MDTLDQFPPPTAEPATAPTTASAPASPRPALAPTPPPRHSAGHIIAIIFGALALLPGLGLLAGGTAIAIAQAAADDGYFTFTPDRVTSEGVAVITDDAWLDDGGPWVLDWLDLDVRLRVEGAATTDDVFVGIARTPDVETYLADAPHSVIVEFDHRSPRTREESGRLAAVAAPADVDIWVASAGGTGERELTWEARGGRWSIVVMNADGTAGVDADVEFAVRSDAVTPIAVMMIVVGGVIVLGSVALLVFGIRGRRRPT